MLRKLVDFVKGEEFQLTVLEDRVHVANYEDVLSLEDDLIRLKGKENTIYIKGTSLTVSKLLDHEILILGNISEILFKK